jgi:hypothetical protein
MKIEFLNGVCMVDGRPQSDETAAVGMALAIMCAPEFTSAADQLGRLMDGLPDDARAEAAEAFMRMLSAIGNELFGSCCSECHATIKAVLLAAASAGVQSS